MREVFFDFGDIFFSMEENAAAKAGRGGAKCKAGRLFYFLFEFFCMKKFVEGDA